MKIKGAFIIIFISLCAAPLVFSQEVTPKQQEKPICPPDAYNQGVDFYNQGDYNKSSEHFVNALNTDSKVLEQWTSYNLGNSNYNRAKAQKQANPQAALGAYREALEFFRRALNIDAGDKNAKYNYELTAQKIKLLEQKMEEQKQKAKQEQNKQENKEQKPGSQSTDQNQSPPQPDKLEPPEQKEAQSAAAEKKDGSRSGAQEEKDMTKEEALNLLNRFEQSEMEQKQLILKEDQMQELEVEKDW